jgi:hypothetical protein
MLKNIEKNNNNNKITPIIEKRISNVVFSYQRYHDSGEIVLIHFLKIVLT